MLFAISLHLGDIGTNLSEISPSWAKLKHNLTDPQPMRAVSRQVRPAELPQGLLRNMACIFRLFAEFGPSLSVEENSVRQVNCWTGLELRDRQG